MKNLLEYNHHYQHCKKHAPEPPEKLYDEISVEWILVGKVNYGTLTLPDISKRCITNKKSN